MAQRSRRVRGYPRFRRGLCCAVPLSGDYGYRLRAMLTFCAFSGVRPGEAMALDWADVNLPALRVHVSKRLYRGQVDLPKSNQARLIALTPPARDALLTLSEREGPVFRSKAGGRLCAPLLSSYWRDVQLKADLSFDWYLSTKHTCVHYVKVKLNLPSHVIAEQMGWSERSAEKMSPPTATRPLARSRPSTRRSPQ
jgi:integrase